MRVNFIYFSCLRDFKSLYYSIKSVLALFPKSKIYVFIKERIPVKSFHKNVTFLVYDFKNNGNLNGKDFVVNLIKIFKEVSKDCDYVAKIDSDVLMFNNRFLESCKKGYSLIGKKNIVKNAQKEVLPYALGGFYLINSKILKKVKTRGINRRLNSLNNKVHNSPRWAEDERITSFIKSLDGNVSLQKECSDIFSILGFWPYQSLGVEIDKITASTAFQCFDTIEFGRVHLFDKSKKFEIRDNTLKSVFDIWQSSRV